MDTPRYEVLALGDLEFSEKLKRYWAFDVMKTTQIASPMDVISLDENDQRFELALLSAHAMSASELLQTGIMLRECLGGVPLVVIACVNDDEIRTVSDGLNAMAMIDGNASLEVVAHLVRLYCRFARGLHDAVEQKTNMEKCLEDKKRMSVLIGSLMTRWKTDEFEVVDVLRSFARQKSIRIRDIAQENLGYHTSMSQSTDSQCAVGATKRPRLLLELDSYFLVAKDNLIKRRAQTLRWANR